MFGDEARPTGPIALDIVCTYLQDTRLPRRERGRREGREGRVPAPTSPKVLQRVLHSRATLRAPGRRLQDCSQGSRGVCGGRLLLLQSQCHPVGKHSMSPPFVGNTQREGALQMPSLVISALRWCREHHNSCGGSEDRVVQSVSIVGMGGQADFQYLVIMHT